LLTLYTTPVIYLYFDRLARRFGGHPSRGPVAEPELVEAR
jgi:multidrug efflux pump